LFGGKLESKKMKIEEEGNATYLEIRGVSRAKKKKVMMQMSWEGRNLCNHECVWSL
jgi:hypothetical protein